MPTPGASPPNEDAAIVRAAARFSRSVSCRAARRRSMIELRYRLFA
jgi:hypothetical protein